MDSSFLVEIFFVVSIVVFISTLYIISPISFLKKRMVLKPGHNQVLQKGLTKKGNI